MAYGKSWDAERARSQPGFRSVASAGRGWSCRWSVARAYWPLLILFTGLQIADVVTTNYALAIPGNWEANPVMRLFQTQFGVAWWTPKLAAVGCAAVVAARARRRWPMIFAVSYYMMIVLGNLACL